MKITVKLRFNDDELGEAWMNYDNFRSLLYSGASTKEDLLEIITYEPEDEPKSEHNTYGCMS
mgnify:CR=1 FL=1